jgi:nicotinamidase-related amidase
MNTPSRRDAGITTPTIKPRFTIDDSIIMLVDHQTSTLDWVKSLPVATVMASCNVLARMALSYDMPLVLTTTMEEVVGPTLPDLQLLAPEAYANRYSRDGQLNCWDDGKLEAGVRQLGRPNIILAGLTTDMCLFWAAYAAVQLGHNVMVIADACGSMSAQGDELTYRRLHDMDVTVTVTNQILTELVDDFGTVQGAKAQKILFDEIVSKLTR